MLAPQVRPGDVVTWDNLKPHQDARVRRAVEPLPLAERLKPAASSRSADRRP